MRTALNIRKAGSVISPKARSPTALLSFKGQATQHTTAKWSIAQLLSALNTCSVAEVVPG